MPGGGHRVDALFPSAADGLLSGSPPDFPSAFASLRGPMRFLVRIILLVLVLALGAVGVMTAGLDMKPPSRTVEKVIPNDRF